MKGKQYYIIKRQRYGDHRLRLCETVKKSTIDKWHRNITKYMAEVYAARYVDVIAGMLTFESGGAYYTVKLIGC